MSNVTEGAIRRVLNDEKGFNPVLQVQNIKGLTAAGQSAPARYRLLLTDGKDTIQAMLATTKNQLVVEGHIQNYCTIKCTEFMTNKLQDTKIMILLACEPGPVIAPLRQSGTMNAQNQPPSVANARSAAPYGHQPPQPPQQPNQNTHYGQQHQQQQQHQQHQQQPVYGHQPPQQPAYGQQPQQQPYGAPAYGQQPQQQPPPQQPYGQQAYGQPPLQQQSAYGQPPLQQAAPSAYGQPPTTAYNFGTGMNAPGAGYGGAAMYGGHNNSAPVSRSSASGEIMPIAHLNPYINAWTIKARVTDKSDIKRWSNDRGEGYLFNIKVIDSNKGELKCTFFKDACDKFYPSVEQGKVYTFSGGKVEQANARYNPGAELEVTFDTGSQIHPVADDNQIVKQNYRFCPIGSLEQVPENTVVDVLAVIKSFEEPSEIISQKQGGKTIPKRDLTVVDASGADVRLTIWGDKSFDPSYPWHESPIVAFKDVKVGSYGGRSLSLAGNLEINPDIPEAHELYKWKTSSGDWQNTARSLSTGGGGKSFAVEPLVNRRTLDWVKDANNISPDGKGMDCVTVTVSNISQDRDQAYESCPKCKKKVIAGMHGMHCEKCQEDVESVWRYIMQVQLADHTGTHWVSLFDDEAKQLMEKSASELMELKQGDLDRYRDEIKKPVFGRYNVILRSKMETHQDETRLKTTCLKIEKIDHVEESRQLIHAIGLYN